MYHHDSQNNSMSGKDILKGAIIGAAVAAAVAVLANKDTREKIAKSVMDAIAEMKKNLNQMQQETTSKIEKASKKIDEKLSSSQPSQSREPAKESPVEQP